MASVVTCHTPPCPPGIAISDPEAHREWHAAVRAEVEREVSVGEIVGAWLDELDPTVVEALVMSGEATMADSPIACTLDVLRKLAREP